MKKMWVALAAVSVVLVQAACGGGDGPAAPSQTTRSQGTVDPALVGSWRGTVDGSLGSGPMVLRLRADGKAEFGGTGRYCLVSAATWGVSGTEFSAFGSDSCDGTRVTLEAPASSINLTGRWTASSGNSGTFSVAKE